MKFFTIAKNLRSVTNDPIAFIVDTLIKLVVNLVISIPLAGDVIARLKGPVLGFLASMVILGVMLFVILITIFVSVFLSPTGFFKYITSSLLSSTLEVPNEGFVQSSSPSQNPFGGNGMIYTSVTAGFMDLTYLLQFGKNHTGIDLVPSEVYYQNSTTYQQNKKIVIFSTHIGKAKVYIDENGGETFEVENTESNLRTIYIHFKDIYVKTGDSIQGGTPLGEMGKTGFATGEHLHYEVRIKNVTNWVVVNPLTYIK